MDVALDALEAARHSGAETVACARAECLPLPSDCVDVAVSVDVLCHETCDDQAALREICRVLKPGGALLLNLPAYEWLKGPHDRAGRNRRRYTAGEVVRLLTAAGLCVQRITYRNTLLFPVACVRRLAQKMFLGSGRHSDVTALPRWLNSVLYAVLAVECRLLRHCNLPFGLSVFAVAKKATGNVSR